MDGSCKNSNLYRARRIWSGRSWTVGPVDGPDLLAILQESGSSDILIHFHIKEFD